MTIRFTRRHLLKQGLLAGASLAAAPFVSAAPPAFVQLGAPQRGRVLILGAGLAGLAAAYELDRLGHDVLVIEARSRVGGRVLTLRDGLADGLNAEAGATRVSDTHAQALKWIHHFDLPTVPFRPVGRPDVYLAGGRRLELDGTEPLDWPQGLTAEERGLGLQGMREKYVLSALGELGDATSPGWPPDTLKKYDDISFPEFLKRRGASTAAISLLEIGSLSTEVISALQRLRGAYWRAKTTKWVKIKGGNDLLPKAFAAHLGEKIRLNSPVIAIRQDERGVAVTIRLGNSIETIPGDCAICTVPFSVLRDVEVTPPFSKAKREAMEQLPYGSVTKVFLQSRDRFWALAGLSGFALTDLPVTEVWDLSYSQPGARGLLACYTTGPAAGQLAGMLDDERIEAALLDVEQLFPGIRRRFEGGWSKCWDKDQWSRGANPFFRPGQMFAHSLAIGTPEGRIYFAGDHASAWPGWMQGALESAERVAHELHEQRSRS